MNISNRESDFKTKVKEDFGVDYHYSPCFGTSNIARIVPGGIILGVSNLDNYLTTSPPKPFVLMSRICPTPDLEFYFGFEIKSDIDNFSGRLKYMLERAAGGDDRFTARNNNVSIGLGSNNSIYLYSKKITHLDDASQDYLGDPIVPDQLFFSAYSPKYTSDAKRAKEILLESFSNYTEGTNKRNLNIWHFDEVEESSVGSEGALDIENISSEFNKCAEEAGLVFNENIPIRYISSLLTKRFVILTGLSGSGKTKLAQFFAKWICEEEKQYKIVPVGADWTNREPLIGFPNALEKGNYILPDNGALSLLIEASKPENQERPFFLILDEMNLSHVERYFADFLSSMESKVAIPLRPDTTDWPENSQIPPEIKLSSNIFIIGTVNIDETTYMFSPKVLDRANVIEFRIGQNEMRAFLTQNKSVNMDSCAGLGANFSSSFVNLSRTKNLVVKDKELLVSTLLAFFIELKSIGAEFGFRSATEILRFAGTINKLEPEWKTDKILDTAIMQKLLPKVHGSRRRLQPVLEKIALLCLKEDENISEFQDLSKEINYDLVQYPLSYEKLRRMYRGLIDNGFTSYAEA